MELAQLRPGKDDAVPVDNEVLCAHDLAPERRPASSRPRPVPASWILPWLPASAARGEASPFSRRLFFVPNTRRAGGALPAPDVADPYSRSIGRKGARRNANPAGCARKTNRLPE